MLTVPLAIFGGIIGLLVAGSSLNIYSQIGLIILIGLAAKNGILIVEFANQLRAEGKDIEKAILEAAKIRLRPILMTSLSTIAGVVPLIIGSGPGEGTDNNHAASIWIHFSDFVLRICRWLLCRSRRGETSHEQNQCEVASELPD